MNNTLSASYILHTGLRWKEYIVMTLEFVLAYFSSYELGQYSWNYVYYTLSASYIFHTGLKWNMK